MHTVTTLTYEEYTDESHTQTVTRTVDTNTEGEAAVYAPFGIAGDVYCQSETKEGTDDVTWMGTFYHYNLTSSEADSTKLQLYPVNTIQLRRATQEDLLTREKNKEREAKAFQICQEKMAGSSVYFRLV